ncbi:MAG: DnaJ domain-containing protein [Microbacterium ginsengisoli]|jgi:hypothetical protein|uniref:J domain-containing protein n=1 Tax=Microbacterium TaxID=33882 RepID=UPI0006F49C75|nr:MULTISPECIES: J domain-containing protein [unclassified Microbacterium]MBN9197930.1 DnaJ domain-containing protein [Microbacterium ginsengisoli]KQR91602.1 molecular chaperone DnaJ [Microbacterium sp. Leaf347]KQR91760.1 molecular chaperone DnaJ [Microbacterium sp. Leaf351]ODU77604.1 MAG: molecular chaperone DnaJ [Microbacterium sp. SCN 71-21]OJU79187.1 MAG: molecular chaperone DnaJ [Microbacterium sp. 71-23]
MTDPFAGPLGASPYEVLGVAASATDDELRRAYRARMRETHPDTGGDAAVFIRVQRAWELIGTPEARAVFDRGRSFSSDDETDATASRSTQTRPDTRPRARAFGQPGGWRRERYLTLIREWVGRGAEIADPYAADLVRAAPRDIRHLLADALAEEATARIVADLGMGYTVWHDVAADKRGVDPDAKLDHIVLGPSGLYGLLSEDFGDPIGLRRGEIVGAHIAGAPITELIGRIRTVARQAGVRFTGAIVVVPDDQVAQAITELGKVRGLLVVVTTRSALATVLRRGATGARPIGGTEVFDVRSRLQQRVEFV